MEQWPIYRLSEDRNNFIREIDDFTRQRLMQHPIPEVTDIISRTIYLERIRLKEEPWKVDPPKEKQFWRRMQSQLVRFSLDQDTKTTRRNNEEILSKVIHRYSEEIVGTFRIKTFLFARRFLTIFFNALLQARQRGFWRFGGARKRLYEKLNVQGDLEKIRALMKEGTVVVVPTHFSNLDSILIGYALDAVVGLPAFSYGAGLNLYNSGYAAYFMNRLGAYRIDRRKKNPIYLETLKAMSNLSIQRGTNNLFFPGGTRSRSGALEDKLKLGMLSSAVEAQRSLFEADKERKIFILPVVLSYHFVLEAQYLIEQHLRRMGKERYIKARDDFRTPTKIIRFIWKVLSEGNDITVSFGEPMDVLGNPVDESGMSWDKYGNPIRLREYFQRNGQVVPDLQRESEYTRLLAGKIVERYHLDNIVLTSHLVAWATFKMLQRQNARLDLYGILRLPNDDYVFEEQKLLRLVEQLKVILIGMEERDTIRLAPQLFLDAKALIRNGISRLGTFHVKRPLRYNRKGKIVSDNFRLLYYYHNRLDSYGLEKKIDWQQARGATLTEV